MRHFRSASEQTAVGPVDADMRRLSEWPVAPGPHEWRLYAIDPFSITLQHKRGLLKDAPPVPVNDRPPAARLNIVACGSAAPIAAVMIVQGARHQELCASMCEPLVVISETSAELPAGDLDRQDILRFLSDPATRVDAILFYDIAPADSEAYLDALAEIRQRLRPRCPVMMMGTLPSADAARHQWVQLQIGAAGMVTAGQALYQQVRQAMRSLAAP